MNDSLKELSFLLGKWKGKAEDQFGEKGVIESTLQFQPGSQREIHLWTHGILEGGKAG
jgi:hypothetical protein